MTDEHPARAEPVPARAAQPWPDYLSATGGPDQLADRRHDPRVGVGQPCDYGDVASDDGGRVVARWGFDALTATSPSRLVLTPEGPKPKDAQNTQSFEERSGPGQTLPWLAPGNLEFRLSSSSAVRFSNATAGPAISATRRYRRQCEGHAPQAASISRRPRHPNVDGRPAQP
jgi:hypothetical protein